MRIFILQTTGGFDSEGSHGGGGVIHSVALAKYWQSLGNEVVFITNAADLGGYNSMGIRDVFRLPSSGFTSSHGVRTYSAEMWLNYFVQKKRLEEIVGAILKNSLNGIDRNVVVTTTQWPSDVLAAFRLSRKFHLPAVIYMHNCFRSPLWHPLRRGSILTNTNLWIIGQIALALAKLGNMLPCVDHPREILEQGWNFSQGVMTDDDFLETILPGDVKQEEMIADRRLGNSDAELSYDLCFIGTVSKQKGVIDLIEGVKKLKKREPAIRVLIAGKASGKFHQKMVRLVEKNDLGGNITILGWISQGEKIELLKKTKLFVFPSYIDSWSLAVMEAVHFGAIPITYDLPAYDYLGPMAIKVPVGNIGALSNTIAWALKLSTGERSEIAKKLREQIYLYDGKKIALQQLKLLEQFSKEGRISDVKI